jgi:hypothetical protein
MNSMIVRTFKFGECGSLVCRTARLRSARLGSWGGFDALEATIIAIKPDSGLPDPVN